VGGADNVVFQFASIGAIRRTSSTPRADAAGDRRRNQIREFSTVHIGTAAGGSHAPGERLPADGQQPRRPRRAARRRLILANEHRAPARRGRGTTSSSVACSAVHQFTRIGRLASSGRCRWSRQDVPPYVTRAGRIAPRWSASTPWASRARTSTSTPSPGEVRVQDRLPQQDGLREAVAHVKAEYGGTRRSTNSSPPGRFAARHRALMEPIGLVAGSAGSRSSSPGPRPPPAGAWSRWGTRARRPRAGAERRAVLFSWVNPAGQLAA